MTLDKLDLKILNVLRTDARMTLAKVARQVRVSRPTVVERVHRLEEAGIICSYQAVVDLAKLGWSILAFISLATTGTTCAKVVKTIQASPEVLECHRITGNDSYILKVVATSIQQLEKFIDKLLPFGQITTSIVMSSPVSGKPFKGELLIA